MLESQRQPVPRDDAGELDTALAFLAFVRSCVLKKVEGLNEEQLRRRLVVSDTTLLGLVQHLAVGERYWIAHTFAGRRLDEEWDFDMAVPADRSADEVVADYRAAMAESDAILATADDPEARTAVLVDGEARTLRWVLAHHTGEVTRHAGHADILRELIDGTTGR